MYYFLSFFDDPCQELQPERCRSQENQGITAYRNIKPSDQAFHDQLLQSPHTHQLSLDLQQLLQLLQA